MGSSKAIQEEALGEAEDLGELARQTLSGVEVNELPPEPLALGVDLGRLATTSRPPAPPSRNDDSDARIDLRSSPGAVAAPRASTPAELAARLRSSRAPAPPTKLPARVVVPTLHHGPAARELDELIASRAFSPTAALASSARHWIAAARNAPSWTWPLCGGLAIGLVIGLALAGDDGGELAPVPMTASAQPSSSATATAIATPVLPQMVPTSHGSALARAAAPASRERARTSFNRAAPQASGPPRAPSSSAGSEAQLAAAPPTSGEPRSLDTLLDQAVGGGAARAATPASSAPGADLPSTPERAEVASTLSALLPRIRFCGGSRAGVATAQIVVKSTGRVTSVRIMGPPFSRTTAARCMERVIRGASFAPFRQASFRVTYPYAL